MQAASGRIRGASRSIDHPEVPLLSSKTLSSRDMSGTPRAVKLATASPWQAGLNLVKCVVGAGSFALPIAFKNSGLILGIISLIIIGAVSGYTMTLIARIETDLGKNYHNKLLTYVEVGRLVFGPIIGGIIFVGIVGVSVGVCAAYTAFVASQLVAVFDGTMHDMTLVTCACIAALAQLRSFKYLAFTSILGDLSVLIGVICVLVYGLTVNTIPPLSDLNMFEFETFPKFFGTAAFLFAVHAVFLPIKQSMAEPQKFAPVCNKSYALITTLNIILGGGGYMLFGNDVGGLVLANLTEGWMPVLAKLVLSIDLIFSMPIVLAAGREILEERIVKTINSRNNVVVETTRTLTRFGLVGCILLIALYVENFNHIADLVGAIANTLMAYILPPLLLIATQRHNMSKLNIGGHLLIVIVGTIGGVIAAKGTIDEMVAGK
eukprot:GFYU01002495.1.p1 GENE.GFYU01002495.1~~GFYU01002495.1.p1  ORF type:complete len:466 (+),score=124.85 GFYU01002495.1:99-1400(+)